MESLEEIRKGGSGTPKVNPNSRLPGRRPAPLLFLVILAFLACQPAGEYSVLRVIDGDTIVVEGDVRVRYIGIDTPELGGNGRMGEALAQEARELNRQLVEGKRVRLEVDADRTDRYGRTLAYVYVGDLLVNEELVRRGLARARAYPPNLKFQDRFEKAEREARKGGLGLWRGSP